MKKTLSLLFALALALSLAACGSGPASVSSGEPAGEPVGLTVVAAASRTETVAPSRGLYNAGAPQVASWRSC